MNIAVGIVVLLLSMACAVIREKEKMNKAPHYRQSGVVFAFLSALFLCIAAECILKTSWLGWISSALTVGVLIYAIVSSVRELGKR